METNREISFLGMQERIWYNEFDFEIDGFGAVKGRRAKFNFNRI